MAEPELKLWREVGPNDPEWADSCEWEIMYRGEKRGHLVRVSFDEMVERMRTEAQRLNLDEARTPSDRRFHECLLRAALGENT